MKEVDVRIIVKKVIIWGYAIEGINCYRKIIANNPLYEFLGFADNSEIKQKYYVNNQKIYSMEKVKELSQKKPLSVIIASNAWREIGEQLEIANIDIAGIYLNGRLKEYKKMTFEQLDLSKEIKFYAGNIYDDVHYNDEMLYGLSIVGADEKHIFHDITQKYPLPDNCIASYQAEDVLEHIEPDKLVVAINEIYRILKPGGLFRICLPDYYSPYLENITLKNENGICVFDPTGGGDLVAEEICGGGHIWFPNYKNVEELLSKSKFAEYSFLCYHTEEGELITKEIDFSKGYINRVSKEKQNIKPIYSIVVDCIK